MHYNGMYMMHGGDRFGFALPFLTGALVGGAAVGISRPRPVYVNPYPPRPIYGPYPPMYGPMPYY